ncbi:hypothetical protein FOMG_19939 [Fusarium oxysporum f. sp. melonis 26406]|uniref:Uncharacterized protein n=1 Tax=Fusarium oxysporum f. sp. melonis 26406 TaxID=1089452 RepID=W9Z4U2_FUSOX|nr:hypothetical protein FOMG_19939 [Fusarium oxysporum f. sp. melonis 26406]
MTGALSLFSTSDEVWIRDGLRKQADKCWGPIGLTFG